MSATEFQIALSIVTVLGAGVSVYVGVKSALAEFKTKINQHDRELERQDERIKYLERAKRVNE